MKIKLESNLDIYNRIYKIVKEKKMFRSENKFLLNFDVDLLFYRVNSSQISPIEYVKVANTLLSSFKFQGDILSAGYINISLRVIKDVCLNFKIFQVNIDPKLLGTFTTEGSFTEEFVSSAKVVYFTYKTNIDFNNTTEDIELIHSIFPYLKHVCLICYDDFDFNPAILKFHTIKFEGSEWTPTKPKIESLNQLKIN